MHGTLVQHTAATRASLRHERAVHCPRRPWLDVERDLCHKRLKFCATTMPGCIIRRSFDTLLCVIPYVSLCHLGYPREPPPPEVLAHVFPVEGVERQAVEGAADGRLPPVEQDGVEGEQSWQDAQGHTLRPGHCEWWPAACRCSNQESAPETPQCNWHASLQNPGGLAWRSAWSD
jgi:hypothetical protein